MDDESRAQRKQLFATVDSDGDGFLTAAEVDLALGNFVGTYFLFVAKPVIMLAFNAACDLNSDGDDDTVDKTEFRMLLLYILWFFELRVAVCPAVPPCVFTQPCQTSWTRLWEEGTVGSHLGSTKRLTCPKTGRSRLPSSRRGWRSLSRTASRKAAGSTPRAMSRSQQPVHGCGPTATACLMR